MSDGCVVQSTDSRLDETLWNEIQHLRKNEVILQEEIYTLRTNEKILKDDITKCRAQYLEIKSNLDAIISIIKRNEESFEKEKVKINLFDNLIKQIQSSDKVLEVRLNKIDSEIDSYKKSAENFNSKHMEFVTDLSNYSTNLSDLKTCLSNSVEDLNTVKCEILRSNEFVWKIENLSSKFTDVDKGKSILITSEPFLSHKNGYKIRLHLYPKLSETSNVGKEHKILYFMGIFFSVMKGLHDDILQWPLKHTVTITIKNQNSKPSKCKQEFSVDNVEKLFLSSFEKPAKDENNQCGNKNFIAIDKLMGSKALFQKDTLYIGCYVNTINDNNY